MNSDKFFSILKLLEKYSYLNKGKEGDFIFKNEQSASEGKRFVIDTAKLQTNFVDEVNWKDYKYFFFEQEGNIKKPFSKVHAFLQGAIQDTEIQKSNDESFLDYQKNVLKMFFGMFAFIDPTKSQDPDEQMPYYLLGPMAGKILQPSFNFKFYYNIQNLRGGSEFTEPPTQWLKFFLAFNEFSRDTLTFDKQDFVRVFNYKRYVKKRNDKVERANNILYISSGEMDTCILQWLTLYLKSTHRLRISKDILKSNFAIDLKEMYPRIDEFYKQNSKSKYIIPNYRYNKEESKDKYKTPKKKLEEWLRLWGLLDSNELPTERLMAVFEWLYYYLKLFKVEGENNEKYYDYREYLALADLTINESGYYYLFNIDKQKINKYLELVETLLPVKTNYEWKSSASKEATFKQLIQLYFEIIFSWEESIEHIEKFSENSFSWEVFAERCRFRPFVHFLFRNFPSSVDSKFIEKSCRGFISFPILSSHKNFEEESVNEKKKTEDIHYVGYFLGHIKDSDSKGRCLFNWHKSTDYYVSETVSNAYEDNFFELRQILNQLGRIESEQIYFRGIVRMHQEEARKQSIHSAIAACMSRNLSHTTGSHKSPWFKNYFAEYFKEIFHYLNNNKQTLPPGIESAIKSIKGGLRKLKIEKENEEAEINNLQTHLLNYFDFVNDNMEFIADVTTNYSPNKTTFNYSVKDIYEEYSSLKLMHHGLFDDKKMETSIKFLAKSKEEDPTNEYMSASVALPNGQLGKTAFYIIIENILRNYYKHTIHETTQPKFYLRVTKSEILQDDYWCVDFFDTVRNKDNKTKRNETLLVKINSDYINKSILQTNGTLRPEGWGFIEMKACAAYLVNYPIEQIDRIKDSNELITFSTGEKFHPLIEANYYSNDGKIIADLNNDNENRNIGYRFYLKKAKKVGIENSIVTNTELTINIINKSAKEGIQILNNDSINNRTQHDLLILKSENEKIDLNQRYLVLDSFDFLKFKNTEEIELFAWIKYIDNKYKSKIQEFQIVKDATELENITNDIPLKKIFLIDDHGKLAKQKEFTFDSLQKYLWYLPDENRTKKDIDLFFREKYSLPIRLRLIEVINTKVSIYDERIQQEVNSSYNNIPQMTLRELHQLGNVFIPDLEVENLTNDKTISNLEESLKARFAIDEYVVIHFTLFERLAENKKYSTSLRGENNLKNYYDKLVREWKLESRGKFLVFCSGRGRPSNLFSGCYYIHLSTLQYFTIRTISKYSLVNVLKSLRKI